MGRDHDEPNGNPGRVGRSGTFRREGHDPISRAVPLIRMTWTTDRWLPGQTSESRDKDLAGSCRCSLEHRQGKDPAGGVSPRRGFTLSQLVRPTSAGGTVSEMFDATSRDSNDALMDGLPVWRRPICVTLLLLRVAVLVVMFLAPSSAYLNGTDVQRTREIANEDGQPYRDFAVEYGPLTTVIDRTLLAAPTLADTELRLGLLNLTCDALLILALATWGRRAVIAYLVLSTPIVGFVYFRTDLLPVALLVVGLSLIRRGAERVGGIAVALGFLAKLWPAVAIPTLLLERRRAGIWALTATVLSTAAWLVWSPFGPWQVLTLRHSTGWQIESTGGAVLLLTGAPVRPEAGAARVGASVPGARPFLAAALVFVFVLVWRYRRDVVASTLALVAAMLFVAPILSPQYVIWALPLIAIVWARDELNLSIAMLLSLLTALVVAMLVQNLALAAPKALALVILARNALLPLVAYQSLRPKERASRLGSSVARIANDVP
jgi:Glycosyltransferase family 87